MSVMIMIKKTHMPERCKGCPLETTHENQFIGTEFMCAALWKTTEDNTFNRFNSRHPDCPLVEIPTPHGRLIDINDVISAKSPTVGEREKNEAIALYRAGWNAAIEAIVENAPTIIEAEDSVNEGVI